MWTISSNDVQQAKDRIDHRRTEMEARYAEDKRALEAETAAIESLERAAAVFAQRHAGENPEIAVPLAGAAAPVAALGTPAAQSDPAGSPAPAAHSGAAETAAPVNHPDRAGIASVVYPDPGGIAASGAYSDPAGTAVPTGQAEPEANTPAAEAAPAAEPDPAGPGEANLPFDILKPGSRWRLNRATRLLNPDGTPSTGSG